MAFPSKKETIWKDSPSIMVENGGGDDDVVGNGGGDVDVVGNGVGGDSGGLMRNMIMVMVKMSGCG